MYLIESTHPDGWTGYTLDKDTRGPDNLPVRLLLPLEEATQKAQELEAKCGPGYTCRAIPEHEATQRVYAK